MILYLIRVANHLRSPEQEHLMAAKDNDDAQREGADGDISLDMSHTAVKKMMGEAGETG